jgi:two-component system CAI-1 autoinducer sensor kinase/phosphatase CqsS
MTTHAIGWVKERWQAWQHGARQWLLDYHRQLDSTVKRLVVLSWIGIIAMPLYYLVWADWFPQKYDNLGLRIFGLVICLPAIFSRRFSHKKWLPAYFFVGLTYVLPFFFTFMFLMNAGSPVWSESLLIALIILFHFDTTLAFFAYVTGTSLAYLAVTLLQGDVTLNEFVLEQWPIQLFAILTVSLAKVGREVLSQEKLTGMASAIATVSHELRTPLRSVDANARGMKRLLQGKSTMTQFDGEQMEQALARIEYEVRHMNSIIDLFLSSASTSDQHLEATEILSMEGTVKSMLDRYPFVDPVQRDLVEVSIRADFQVRGQTQLCSMVLFNLLRNALNAIHRAGKGRVRIVVDGAKAKPRLLFIDTGCGIEKRHLPHIFKRFFAYPEQNGTGIGLTFCKKVLEAWGASIRCSARPRAYTIFVIEFPAIK